MLNAKQQEYVDHAKKMFGKTTLTVDELKKANKKLNAAINQNLIEAKDKPKTDAIKTSQVKFVHLRSIQNFIIPFLDFIITSNTNHFGFDLFQLTLLSPLQ